MFMWHEKHYVGAAHGIVGIMYMLLQVKKIGIYFWSKVNNINLLKLLCFPLVFGSVSYAVYITSLYFDLNLKVFLLEIWAIFFHLI